MLGPPIPQGVFLLNIHMYLSYIFIRGCSFILLSQPNATSTRVWSDKVLSWTTHHHPLILCTWPLGVFFVTFNILDVVGKSFIKITKSNSPLVEVKSGLFWPFSVQSSAGSIEEDWIVITCVQILSTDSFHSNKPFFILARASIICGFMTFLVSS